MKVKISTVVMVIAFLLFRATIAVSQQTKVNLKKDGTTVYQSVIAEIDSVIFYNPVKDGVSQEVIDLILGQDALPEKEEYLYTSEILSERKDTIDDIVWNCSTKKYSASKNPDDFFMYNPLASILWPGNLVQGKSIASGVPTSIPISKRQPGNISFAIVSPDTSGVVNQYYRTVDKMQFSYVNQAMNEILAGYGGNGYANYSYSMKSIEDASELNFELNAGYSGGTVKVATEFGVNFNDKKSRYLVELHQQYYTMVYDDPAGFDDVFTPDITVDDLKNYTGNNNPICYISSVTYGRVYYLLYESTASKQELDAALKFSLWGVNASIKAQHEAVMNQTEVKIVQIGGNAADGLNQATALNIDSLQAFLTRGANFSLQSPGAPISYVIKYLKDASLVRMNKTLEYEVEECDSLNTIVDGISYIDEYGVTQLKPTDQINRLETTTTMTDGKWYYVSSDLTVNTRITVSGTAHLILTDGCNLSAVKGINVPVGSSLTIYGQVNQSGKLTAIGTNGTNGKNHSSGGKGGDAGIGGSGGTGGNNSSVYTGNSGGNAGSITINGGIIIAQGGKAGNGGSGAGGSGGGGAGAGIGGGGAGGGSGSTGTGDNGNNGGKGGNGAFLVINGGIVTAIRGANGNGTKHSSTGGGPGGGGMSACIGGGGGGGAGGGGAACGDNGKDGDKGATCSQTGSGGKGGDGGKGATCILVGGTSGGTGGAGGAGGNYSFHGGLVTLQ